MSVHDVQTWLRSLGCVPVRRKGSHEWWRTPSGRGFPLVANRRGQDVSYVVLATVRRVLRNEGLI